MVRVDRRGRAVVGMGIVVLVGGRGWWSCSEVMSEAGFVVFFFVRSVSGAVVV